MTGENNGHVARSQNTLLIDNFKEEDVGTYMCMARNVAGIVTRNITLDLEGKITSLIFECLFLLRFRS